MARQIQLRRGTAADWTSSNPVLTQGEVGYETDTNKFKIGDGSSTWSALSYFTQSQSGSDLVSAINGSAGVIDDDNIASTIARDSEVSSAISTHAGNATAHHSNANDPTASEKSALAGTSGTPSGTNKYVTNDDTRMTNARTPSSHGNEAHSSTFITSAAVTYETLNTNGDVGTTASTLCAGNDSRLSDARTPVAHAHGSITNTGTIGTTADLPIKTTTGGALTTGAFGTGATDFAAGNHTHSGYATSTHASTHVTGGSDVIANAIASGNAGLMSGADKAKLDAIEAGATADLTASEIVTLVNASAYVFNDANLAATLSRTSHVHGNITAAGYLGSTASIPLITGTAGIIQAGSFGSAAGTFCVGNDSRLSDARTPISHNNTAHSETYITSAGVTYEALNGNSDVGTGSTQVAAGDHTHSGYATSTHVHGNITNTGYLGSTASIPLITGTAGIIQAGSFGSAAGSFCQGNDSRLSDARTPTAHTHGNVTNTGYIGSTANLPIITGTAGILQAGSFGSTANTFCVGNDSRLSDARTPTSHVHGNITNAGAIGAVADLPVITTTSGVLTTGSFGTGATNFAAGNHTHTGYASTTHASAHVTGGSDVIANAIAGGNAGLMSGADKTKLDGIETAATADMTGSEIVTAINGVASIIDDENIASTISRTSHVHGNITAAGAIGSTATLPIITTTGGVLTAGSFGSGAGTFCQGNDSRLSDARTPTSHAHGSITNTGYLGSTANLPLITGTAGVIQAGSFGTGANTFCVGNDSRLSDARTPTSHVHGNISNAGAIGTTADLPIKTTTSGVLVAGAFGTGATDFAAGNHTHSGVYEPVIASKGTAFNVNFGTGATDACTGNDSRLSDARTPTSHAHGSITNTGYLGVTANLPLITGTSGIIQAGSFGTGANTFCVGNDSRLSDARAPTSHNNSAHSETYITSAGVTYEQLNTNGDVGTTASTLCAGNDSRLSDARTPTSHTHGNITNAGAIGSTTGLPIITTTSGVLTTGSFGSSAGTFCAGDDTRLVTNAKQADRPFVFQSGHTAWATGLSNEEIGRIQLQTGETLYIKRVEMQIKGGGSSASLSVNAYDSTNVTTIASQTAGGVNTTGGNSGSAALVLIRLTNSVGSTQNASVYISGWIRS